MSKGTDESGSSTEAADRLLNGALDRLQHLAASDNVARLFRGGLESLELQVKVTGIEIAISLKGLPPSASSFPSVSALSLADDESIFIAREVQASFNAEGHKVIALIAVADLEQRAPATMAKVNSILEGGGRDLLSAAIFPDVIRPTHRDTGAFHFVDFEFEEGVAGDPDLPVEPHVISKIAEFGALLRARDGDASDRVDHLSWLIHLFGDIHQPLHCITRISSEHPRPDGDRGGNGFALRGRARNLHSLWDSSVNFTSESEQQIADSVRGEHTRESLAGDLAVTDAERWARRSFQIAKQHAYGPLGENRSSPPKPSGSCERVEDRTTPSSLGRLSTRESAGGPSGVGVRYSNVVIRATIESADLKSPPHIDPLGS